MESFFGNFGFSLGHFEWVWQQVSLHVWIRCIARLAALKNNNTRITNDSVQNSPHKLNPVFRFICELALFSFLTPQTNDTVPEP